MCIRDSFKTISEGSTENSLDRNFELFPGHDNTNDFDASVSLLLMPNPATDVVRIENMHNSTPIRVYDSSGMLVFDGRSNSNGVSTIDVSSWAQGVYSVVARDSKARRSVLRLEVLK